MTMTSTTVPSCLPSLVLLATAPMVLAMGPELDGLQQVGFKIKDTMIILCELT